MFVRGIMEYGKQHGDWSLTTSPPSLIGAGEETLTLDGLRGWPGHGAIAAILNKADIRSAHRLGIPVVNLAATLRATGIPSVLPDHYYMGRLAAEHLLERGLRRLAYFGLQGFWFSQERCRGFVECAQEAGVSCDILEMPQGISPSSNWKKHSDILANWLKKLRTPLGLLAVQDYRAHVAMEECEHLGLHIPHDVAVIGMENDPTLCEFCWPSLSSVSRNSWRLGYETASMLDRLMDGKEPSSDVVIQSDGVVARQSTDTIAVDDPHLAAALHFIHDNISQAFNIDRVVRATSISRRQLEFRFRKILGCTPNDYLSRRRVEKVKDLLSAPAKTKFHKLAMACGFSNVDQMRLVFKRETGMTPLEYRNKEIVFRNPPKAADE